MGDISRRSFFGLVGTGLVTKWYDLYDLGKLLDFFSLDANRSGHSKKVRDFYDQVMPQIWPGVKQYANSIDALLDNIYNLDSEKVVPEFAHRRVKDIFSGDLSNIQEWNEKLFDEGLRAHYTAYLLQDFRNSHTAGLLSDFYNCLSDTDKNVFEQRLKYLVPNQRTYEFLFRAGMKPHVFDPRIVPENNVKVTRPDWNDGQPYFVVTDSEGRHICAGVEESPCINCEGNDNHVRDRSGELIGFVNYYRNIQPNFMFYDAISKKDGKDGHFFKTYLGGKGMMFWYKVGDLSDVRQISLTGRQVHLLRDFFRWKRPSYYGK